MQLVIDGREPPELLSLVSTFIALLARRGVAPTEGAVADLQNQVAAQGEALAETATQVAEPAPATETKKRGRKSNAEKAATQTEQAPAPTAPSTASGATKEALKAALQSVIDVEALGMDAAMKIVGGFKNADGAACSTLREIQEADYAKVIAACGEAVKNGKVASAADSLMGD
jgi:chemotaxis protein histidine kinase CheA